MNLFRKNKIKKRETKMKVRFYGHVHQYHNIKDEIDKNISEVLESGSYVMDPCFQDLKKG